LPYPLCFAKKKSPSLYKGKRRLLCIPPLGGKKNPFRGEEEGGALEKKRSFFSQRARGGNIKGEEEKKFLLIFFYKVRFSKVLLK
jgi:hypothetical protein